jgi:hypothetical protein
MWNSDLAWSSCMFARLSVEINIVDRATRIAYLEATSHYGCGPSSALSNPGDETILKVRTSPDGA